MTPQGDVVQGNDVPELTHFRDGLPRMVDVSGKVATAREATAEAWVRLPPEEIGRAHV